MRLIWLLCILLPLASGFKEYIDEYSRNIYDDDEEYSLNNDEAVEVPNGREHYIRKIRSIEEDYRNVERVDLEEYFVPQDEPVIRNKRDLIQQNNIEKLGNPLEIIVLDVENNTKSDEIQTNDLKINDFIRFKRDVDLNAETEKSRPKRDKENNSQDSRVKEDWLNKQDHPKQEEKSTIRAPRVHFVTQRRSESSPSPVFQNYDSYDNYPRSRNYERYPRRYDDSLPYKRNYDNPYFETERSYYSPGNKQRRIIYYATLPEDSRRPRDGYNYRDTYRDDRYLSRDDRYRYRKPYVAPKSRYDDLRFNKNPYPGKVSADVNIREVKKNPERRIYSEVDRRYDFDVPQYELPDDPYRIGNK